MQLPVRVETQGPSTRDWPTRNNCGPQTLRQRSLRMTVLFSVNRGTWTRNVKRK